METIMDCLKKDLVSITENGFKDVDSIVCSLLTNLRYDIKDDTSIKDLAIDYNEDPFLALLASNKRYKNIIIKHFIRSSDNEERFGLIKLDFEGNGVISFQGTDGSILSWEENFRIGFEYPTKTQQLAIDYLNSNIDSDTIIIGHSKGGNLAIVSALECKKKSFIKKIYNLDGPGYDNEAFKRASRMKSKIITYVPVNSFVGVLMNNYNVECIQSSGLGFQEHNIANWYIEDYNLVKGELSENSIKANKMSIYALNNFNKDEARIIVELFFGLIKEKNIKSKKEYMNNDISSIFDQLEALDIDANVKNYYIQMFKVMLS